MENAQLIQWIVSVVVSLIVGAIWKKTPDSVPNGVIPLLNGLLCSAGFALIGGMGFTVQAFVAGMSAAWAATATVESGQAVRKLAETAVDKAGIVVLVAALGLLVAGGANAEEKPIRFRQHYPAWISTNYSDSDAWQKENAPYLKAQASMAMSLLRAPAKIGPVVFDPSLAFTFRSINWPVGKSSSPMEENNYLPEAFIRFNEDQHGYWRGARVGWLHSSTGTDSASGSIDRVLVESKFGHELIIGQHILELSGYARGWYTVSTGAETAGIEKYINFSLWEDAGGELVVIAEADGIGRGVVTLGLSYQVYEVYIPLADAYDIDLFGQLHHGNADGIIDYADRHTSGGVGLALVR